MNRQNGKDTDRYKKLVEGMAIGFAHGKMIFKAGEPTDFTFLDVNKAYEKLTGLKDVVGKKVTEVLPDIRHSNPGLLEIYGRVALGGTPEHFERYIERLKSWVSVSVHSPEKNHFVAMVEDITARKRVEEELRESAARFRLLFNSGRDAVTVSKVGSHGLPTNFVQINDAACEGLGYTREEMLHLSFEDITAPDFAGLQPARMKTLLKDKQNLFESVQIAKDGRRIPTEVSSTLFEMDGGPAIMSVARDMTERKRAEEAQRNSEERYRRLVETTDTGYVILDSQGVVLDANPEYVRLSGHEKLDEILGRNVVEWTADEERKESDRAVETCMKQGFIRNLEVTYVDKDGNRTPVEINATVIETEGKKEVLTLCRDISERRKASASLRESEERFSKAFVTSPYAFMIANTGDGRILEINDAFTAISGFTREEALASSTLSLKMWVHEEDRRRMVAALRDSGAVVRLETRLRAKNGNVMTVLLSAHVIKLSNKSCTLSIIEDITDRKRAEDALKESEARYRALIESSPDAITQSDLNGTILMCNRQTALLHGYESPEDLIGVSAFGLFAPDELQRAGMNLQKTLDDTVIKNAEYRFLRKDGSQFHAELSAKVVKDAQGTPTSFIAVTRDITERRQAEESLTESEEKFRNVFDNAAVGKSITRMDGTMSANPAFCQMLGYTREELSQRTWQDITHPDDIGSTEQDLKKLHSGDEHSIRFTKRYFKRDGSVIWADVSTVLQRDSQGKPLYYITGVVDITERKRAEEALKNSEAKLLAVLDAAPFPVAIVDVNDDKIHFWSHSAQTLFGHTAPSASAWYTIAYPDPQYRHQVVERWKPFLDRARSSGQAVNTGEYRVTCSDGSVRVCEIYAAFITDNLIVTFNDITEKKHAAEALAAEKERLAVTLRSIGDAVIATDVHGAIVLMNKVAEDLTGWPLSEAAERPLAEVFHIVNELTREPSANPVEKVLASGSIVTLENHTLLVARDGTEFAIADSGAPIKDREGNTVGVVLVFRDMTEKQKLIDTIQRAAKLESIGVLAGGIAHDFNNLMGGIFGYIHIASEVSKDDRTAQYLAKALNTMDRARALTQQLLTFAKGGAPVRQVGHLFPFVKETAQFALSGANVSCRFDVPGDLWACSFDKNQIGQVIDNLIINAQQAMPFGGTIELTARNIVVAGKEYPALPRGTYVRLSVADIGIGMSRQLLARIFDPFFTTKEKGHGLGLATCYSIVNRHGGCIDVDSEQGKGSTFHVYLPALPESSLSAAEIPPAKHTGSGVFVIMDDEKVIRETVSAMLGALGYTVVCKENGRDALDFLIQEHNAHRAVSALILDLTIPGGMGGKEVVKEIRKLSATIPVFVSSGYADDPVMTYPVEYGFTASICKPFLLSELSEMLNKHMGARK